METSKFVVNESLSFSMDPKETRLNNNIALLGSPGSGKTHLNSYNIKNMLDRSHVLIDVKGSMSGFLDYFKSQGYKTYHFNLIDPKDSDSYSPFAYVRPDYESMDILSITNAMYGEPTGSDLFWDENASLFLGIALTYLYEAFDENNRDFTKLDQFVSLWRYDEDSREKSNKILKWLINVLENCGRNRELEKSFSRITVISEKTIACIIQTLYGKIINYLNSDVCNLLSKNEIDFRDFLNQKVCLVISINDADTSLHNIAGLMITQLIQFLIREVPLGGALEIPVQFHLDDCGSYYIKDFEAILSTARSRGIGFTCLFQSQAQLKKLYRESYVTIMQCFDTILYFGGNDRETVDLIKNRSEFTLDYIHTLPIGECFIMRRAMPTNCVPILDLSDWKVPKYHRIKRNRETIQSAEQSYQIVSVTHLYEKMKNGESCYIFLNRHRATPGKKICLSKRQILYLNKMLKEYKAETPLHPKEELAENVLAEAIKYFNLLPLETDQMEVIEIELSEDSLDVITKCLYGKLSEAERKACEPYDNRDNLRPWVHDE